MKWLGPGPGLVSMLPYSTQQGSMLAFRNSSLPSLLSPSEEGLFSPL